jgi:uncharacterized membrane protein YesL
VIHWAWLVFAFFGGVIFGMFVIALAEVSRDEEREQQKRKWWE